MPADAFRAGAGVWNAPTSVPDVGKCDCSMNAFNDGSHVAGQGSELDVCCIELFSHQHGCCSCTALRQHQDKCFWGTLQDRGEFGKRTWLQQGLPGLTLIAGCTSPGSRDAGHTAFPRLASHIESDVSARSGVDAAGIEL